MAISLWVTCGQSQYGEVVSCPEIQWTRVVQAGGPVCLWSDSDTLTYQSPVILDPRQLQHNQSTGLSTVIGKHGSHQSVTGHVSCLLLC